MMGMEVRHCQQVIRDLLDCARKPEPHYEPTDLKQLVASTVNSAVLNQGAHAMTKLNQAPEATLSVLGNSSYLKQAFLNVLQNSYDAITDRGTVTVMTRQVDGQAEVVIEDTGCGIPDEDMDKVFEPLFTTKGAGKGTGLGLAVAHDIIEKHNGSIRIESQVGQGTKVIIAIPLLET